MHSNHPNTPLCTYFTKLQQQTETKRDIAILRPYSPKEDSLQALLDVIPYPLDRDEFSPCHGRMYNSCTGIISNTIIHNTLRFIRQCINDEELCKTVSHKLTPFEIAYIWNEYVSTSKYRAKLFQEFKENSPSLSDKELKRIRNCLPYNEDFDTSFSEQDIMDVKEFILDSVKGREDNNYNYPTNTPL